MADPEQKQNDVQPAAETPAAQPIASDAQQTKEELPVVQPLTRPSPQKPIAETGSVIVAKALAAQLGTALGMIVEGLIDERKLAVLDELEITALNHFQYRHEIDGIRYWGYVVEGERVGSQGKEGIGRRHILTALANTSGTQAIETAKQPNVMARNIWDRGWKEKAAIRGEVVRE